MNEELELTCPQVELSILGSFFKQPQMFFSYIDIIKNSEFAKIYRKVCLMPILSGYKKN